MSGAARLLPEKAMAASCWRACAPAMATRSCSRRLAGLTEGATLAVLGRNGVGKTTLLATIMGHTTLRAGSIRFGGVDPWRGCRAYPPRSARHRLRAAGARDLSLARRWRRICWWRAPRPGRWSLARVYDFFPALAERRRNGGNELSGGEQQMLAIGRALMGNPRLLLLDEPLEGLAPVIVDAVLKGLDRLKREDSLTILLVEQHARLALEFAGSAIVLDRGAIVYSGESRELLNAPERLNQLMGVARETAGQRR
jgi:branched-chain amino acid transport system ATP-binding protein